MQRLSGKKINAGFTLFEIIIVIAILAILGAIVVFDFVSFKKTSDLNNNVQEFVSILRLAQNKTLSSENYSQYGVYIDTGVSPNQYILFKGIDYGSRPTSFDQVYSLQDNLEFYNISLGGGNKIVFDRLTGNSENFGTVSIRSKITPDDTSSQKTIYIASSGAVGFEPPATILDTDRVKDSRHIHVGYSRTIDTANENIVLIFNDSEAHAISISSYLSGDEFEWQGTVNVDGADQFIEIKTHKLNDPDTLFSIHRDRRYNNKSLKITISGDSSGNLAQYSADGLTTSHSSIYVSSFEEQ